MDSTRSSFDEATADKESSPYRGEAHISELERASLLKALRDLAELQERIPMHEPPPADEEIRGIVTSMSQRYEKNRRLALPQKPRARDHANVEAHPIISAPARSASSWVVEVRGPIFKGSALPRIPGAPGSSWWDSGNGLVATATSSPHGKHKVSSVFAFKHQGITYNATCVTRTTSLRQESYRGETQWIIDGSPSNTKIILKFIDTDWTEEAIVSVPLSVPLSTSKGQARSSSRKTQALVRRMSFWRKLEV